ncbi:MAG TPA: hypothetical protein VGK94_11150 [Candidatus Polarisedimenticolia bacterium]|jgi:hypothetical protein
MKRVLRGFLGLALCVGLANAAGFAAASRASRAPAPVRHAPYTVAQFASDLATAMGMPAGDAVAALQGRGIRIGNPSAPLTEGDLVNLLSQAGVAVTTTQPDKSVDQPRGREVLAAFGSQLSAQSGGLDTGCVGCSDGQGSNPVDDFNNGNGSGGKYKRKKKNCQTGSD